MADTNWPNPDRPGVPMFPERDACHVTIGPFDTAPTVLLWFATEGTYLFGKVIMTPKDLEDGRISYLGPVLSPAQIAEMLAGERERCAQATEKEKPTMEDALRSQCMNSAFHAISRAAANIRNLGDAP